MNRRSARRHVSAGAILALALWMGGLPAAVADEPVPDTPTAAASASSAVGGGDTAADATPVPEPSPSVEATTPVERTEPAPSTEPTPSPDATPSPEPSTPGPDPAPTGEQPTKGAEPAPVPRPTPTVGPHTSTSTRGHAPGVSSAAGPITIGDLNCESLAATVVLDNSESAGHTTFTITVARWTPDSWFQDVSEVKTSLTRGEVRTVSVKLVRNAYNRVAAMSSDGAEASKETACGSFTYDPRATVQPFDCASLTAVVVFDNSRSTDAVGFHVIRTAQGGPGQSRRHWIDLQVGAGVIRAVDVPLLQAAENSISVGASGPYFVQLTESDGMCGYLRHASIPPLDCSSLTGTVSLESEDVPVPTEYTVRVGDGLLSRFEGRISVAAGTRGQFAAPLADNTRNVVTVLGPGDWVLAERWGACGTVVQEPAAAIGTFDCTTLSVPVTLDNSASTVSVRFTVSVTDSTIDHDHDTDYVVAPGVVRQVNVVLEHDALTSVRVLVDAEWVQGMELAVAHGPICGLTVKVSKVNCTSDTVRVTLTGVPFAESGIKATYVVSSTKYPQLSAAYAQEVVIPTYGKKALVIPVAQLLGGGVRVRELHSPQPVYEEPLTNDCRSGSGGSTTGPAYDPGTAMLAATGADGLGQLTVGGLLMLTLGGVLLRVGRGPRA